MSGPAPGDKAGLRQGICVGWLTGGPNSQLREGDRRTTKSHCPQEFLEDLVTLDAIQLENSVLTGLAIGEGLDHRKSSLDVHVDGQLAASGSPIFPRLGPAGQMLSRTGVFRIPLPEASRERQIAVEIRNGASQEVLAQRQFVQKPTRSPHGLSATAIMKLHRAPLAAVNGFVLTQGKVILTGMALAPGGDPRRVSVKMEEGVSYALEYPLADPGAAATYWYWPNSAFCVYRLTIDLAKTRRGEEFFRVTFVFDGTDVDKCADIKNTIWIPKNINAYQNYPPQDNLTRVQTYDNISGVTVKGYSDCCRLIEIAKRYGLTLGGAKVLDWGMGHGRIVRHLNSLDSGVQAFGIDIDAENAAWASEHLPGVSVSCGPLMPPMPYPDCAFDLVYGISVMTHLARPVQEAWLQEIRRILRPGGMALLTFSGDTNVAYASRFYTEEWLNDYLALGRGPELPSKDLVGKISDPEYYRHVTVSLPEVIKLCEPHFDVLDVLECMFGYQDLAVLSKAA